MTANFDYTNKPWYCTTEIAGTVATNTATPRIIVAPFDLYLTHISMGLMANGSVAGNTEIYVAVSTKTTGRVADTNTFQIAHNYDTLSKSFNRSNFNSTGLAKIDAGDQIFVSCVEIPTTASTGLTVVLTGMGA